MAYVTQAEVESSIPASMLLAVFDDNNDGVIDDDVLDTLIARASAMVDAWIAPVYKGPFPIAQVPVPAMIRELTIQYVLAVTYERSPEATREGEIDRWKRADDMGKRLQSAVQRIPDYAAQPKPANVGGIVTDDAKRVIIAGADGYPNRGDF